MSGADQRPLGKRPLPNCRVCGPCQGLTNVVLPSANDDDDDDPLEVRSVSGSRLPFSCQEPTPGAYGPCEGPMSVLLRSASPLGNTVLVRGRLTSFWEVPTS